MKSARACPAAAGVGQWKPPGGQQRSGLQRCCLAGALRLAYPRVQQAARILPRQWKSHRTRSWPGKRRSRPDTSIRESPWRLRCTAARSSLAEKLDGPKLARALHGHGESLHSRNSNPPLRSISIPSRGRVTGQVARANPWKGAHRGLTPFQCAGFFANPVQSTPHASGSQAASRADRLLLPAPMGNAAVTALGFTLSAQSANSNCVGAGIVICVRAGVLHASRCLQQRNIKFKARAGARERSGTGGRRKGHHPLHARDASPSHKGSRERILVARGGGRHRVTARCRVAGA